MNASPDSITRRRFASVAAGAAVAGRAQSRKRPNVLIIMPDQWRGQALGCTGNADVQTPHLDRLASQGILLNNMLSNTPVCCPARASILTGTYTSGNGMTANDLRLRESIETMGDWFGRAGYRTAFIGKWHLDGGPREPGFVPPGRRRHGFQYWAANECRHNYFHNWYFRDTDTPIAATKYESEAWTDVTIDFLHAQEGSRQPFFLMMAPGTPHDPYVSPPEYLRRYDPSKLTMRPNWVEGTARAGRREIAAYYASITALDDQIGRLIETLRTLHLDENTIILFTSDHGDMLGSHGKILKRKPWEESIRVPGILRYAAAVKAGRKSDLLFTHVDIAPTLLALCGIAAPTGIQGTDLSWAVLGRRGAEPQSALIQIFGPYRAGGVEQAWRAVRTHRFLYARTEARPWLLYDLEKDPYELTNLIDEPSMASVRADMEQRLRTMMEKAADSWKLDWTAPVEDNGRLYRHKTFYSVDEYLQWEKEQPASPSTAGRG